MIWFKSFLFCRLNLTDIDREQTIYRSCEQLEFPAENFQVLRVNILNCQYSILNVHVKKYSSLSLPQNLFNLFSIHLRYSHGE